MATYGYVRVSSADQCEDRQIIAMQKLGVPSVNVYIDKQSGKNTARPGLQKLMSVIKSGDTVIVESISRFARNTRDLLELVEKLSAKGVEFVSQKEHIDTSTPSGRFMLTVFAAMSEWERDIIRQRQAEGIKAAKMRGVQFGRPVKKPPADFVETVKLWEREKITFKQVLERTGLKQATFYNRLREYRSSKQS